MADDPGTRRIADDPGIRQEQAARLHARSVERHLAAADWWARRGDATWASFERRCADVERELVRLESDRARLERLRGQWLTARRDSALHAELTRRSALIEKATDRIRARDETLEQERTRLRDQRARARAARAPEGGDSAPA